jgi:RNA polymerase sigma-70 factor, ECF subfamily
MLSQIDPEALLRSARQGNSVALGELLEHYRPYLMVIAQRYLDQRVQSRLDPADVVQITHLEAQKDFSEFWGEEIPSLLAWLRNILRHNIATAHQRHLVAQKRSMRREVSTARPPSGNGPQTPRPVAELLPSESTSPSQRVLRDEAAALLAIALEKLPSTQAEAIRLRYIEGYSLVQIAQRMDKTEMAAAGLLKRGLQGLRVELLENQQLSGSILR